MEEAFAVVQPPLPPIPPMVPVPPPPPPSDREVFEQLPVQIQNRVHEHINSIREEALEKIASLETALGNAVAQNAVRPRSPSIAGSANQIIEQYDPENPGIQGPTWGEYGQGTVLRLLPDFSNLPAMHEPLPNVVIFNGRTLCEKDRIKVAFKAAKVDGFIPTGVFSDSIDMLSTYYTSLKTREAKQKAARTRGAARGATRGRFGHRFIRGGRFKPSRGGHFGPRQLASNLETIVRTREQDRINALEQSLSEAQRSLSEAQALNASLGSQLGRLTAADQKKQEDLVRIRGERERLRVEVAAAKAALAQAGIQLPHVPLPPQSVYNAGTFFLCIVFLSHRGEC